ncbi:macrolide family glycosyltransferase [Nonomuraea sp. 3-1Str]|uniref:macrolide family glycosyltransferase n=1 Tax=Nonomuraea sp. 3-1Str TaxID=2929801 RepID=UPI00287072B2|nr:macrolide family glycosyltransferase [Nonomuraea sp. 3-1Str]
MTRHYLFMCQPDHGHVIPSLAVVAELVRRGHRVTYLTGGGMAPLVEETGAGLLCYDSIYAGADLRALESDPLALVSLFLDESRAMLDAADRLLTDRPDLVVYDLTVLHAGRLLARKLGIPATQLIPIFASNEHYSFLGSVYAGERSGPDLPGWVDGMLARTRALASDHGVEADPAELWWDVQDSNLVSLPRSFQPAGDTFDERFAFVGPCLGERGFLAEWEPPDDGLPVALLTFGTVAAGRPELFRTCVRAFAELPWRGVVTLPPGMDPGYLGPLPPTIEVRRWVSHVSVLRHATVAVTHGGLGTAMEALHWGCPMVVVPATPIDRVAARRVEELGLGRALDPDTLTPEGLVAAVLAVAGDERVRHGAQAMRRDIERAGGTGRAADLLEGRLAEVMA